MHIELPSALAAFVRDLVRQGRYADEADVVRDAVRRMAERDIDPETGLSLVSLRAELDAAEAGPRSDASTLGLFDRVAARALSAAE